MIKKQIFSREIKLALLATVLLLGLFCVASNANEAAGYDTSIFEGNPVYLMQEHFIGSSQTIADVYNHAFSGWDIDYRGGRVVVIDNVLRLLDGDDKEKISMNHKLLSHKAGKLVFETAFSIDGMMTSGYYYKVFGKNGTVLMLKVEDGMICVYNSLGEKIKLSVCEVNTVYNIKALFSMEDKIVSISINENTPQVIPFYENTDEISEVEIGTGVKEDCYVSLRYVNFYINYMVNERFMTTPDGNIPYGWELNGGTSQSGISKAFGSSYSDDENGFMLVNSTDYPDLSFSKNFDIVADSNVIASWNMLIPSKHDGIKVSLNDGTTNKISITATNSNFVVNGSIVYEDYKNNLWYNFQLEVNTQNGTLDIYINHKLAASDISFVSGLVNYIEFSKSGEGHGELLIDDVIIHKSYEKYEDYPPEPLVPMGADNIDEVYHVGMIMYSMWREGNHFGWDTISPYASQRKPYLGWYAEGEREVADWENKWLIEHGVGYEIFPFVRPNSPAGEPVKMHVRGEALHNGYMNSEYSDHIKFAVMLSGFNENNCFGADEYIENVLPYLTEHYFKDPRYMVVENKPIIYTYGISNFVELLGQGDTLIGYSELNKIINAIQSEARSLGFDDIILAVQGSPTVTNKVVQDNECVYIYNYGWGTDKYSYVIQGIEKGYTSEGNFISSVPMGYDTTPWRASKLGIIDPEGISHICDFVKENSNEANTSGIKNLVTFTCWNEYGEGHFFAPSNAYGFDYLNVIRNTFTSAGINQNEYLPTETALARMGVLYPQGREKLKTKQDKQEYTVDEINAMNVLYRHEFLNAASVTALSKTRCTAQYDSINQTAEFVATGYDPQVRLSLENMGIDASSINAVRICAYASGESQINLLYFTTDELTYGDNKNFFANVDGTSEYKDYILVPAMESKLTGDLIEIRFDPDDSIIDYGGRFGIKYIEFLGGNVRTRVKLEGEEVAMVSTPIIESTVYIPAYNFLISNLGAYATWDALSQSMTIEKDRKILVVESGSNVIRINDEEKQLAHTPFYSNGNLFIPYTGIIEELGYLVEYNADMKLISYESIHGVPVYNQDNPYIWEFNNRDNFEGWVGTKIAKMTVRDGMLRLSSYTTDPIISCNNVNIDPTSYKCAVIRIKNTIQNATAKLRVINETGDMITYSFPLLAEGALLEYVVDLNDDPAYVDFGKITFLRFDPMDKHGAIYIDSIKLLPEVPPNTVTIAAFEKYWVDNIVNPLIDENKNYFSFYNMQMNSTNGFPIVTTDRPNVLEIVPVTVENDALFSVVTVLYNGSQQSINAVCDDNRLIKVSFWYKSKGNCTQIRVENRTSNNIINTATISPVEIEWSYFEHVFDLSDSTIDPTEKRWISLRVKINSTLPNPGIYVDNFKISCLQERSITEFNGQDILYRVITQNHTDSPFDMEYELIIAEYSESGTLTNVIKHDVVGEVLEKSVNNTDIAYTPLGNKKIKAFVWRDIVPLCKAYVLTQ